MTKAEEVLANMVKLFCREQNVCTKCCAMSTCVNGFGVAFTPDQFSSKDIVEELNEQTL